MIDANQATTSWPKPPEVIKAVRRALVSPPEDAARLLEAARAEIGAFLGVADPQRLLLTPGCTSALAVALDSLPWQAGDVVVTSSLEHQALAAPVERLARHRGVIHRRAPYRPGSPIEMDFVEQTLRRERVRLVAVTAASNVTGEILPVQQLAGLTHGHGALLLVDAAQTVGITPLDAGQLGADILAFAGHKGALGPQGIGGLWASPGVAFDCPAAACAVGTATGGSTGGFPGYCEVGSANLAGAAGLAAGMRWLRERGAGTMGRAARSLATQLVGEVQERRGLRLYGGADAERTATVSLQIDGLAPERAEGLLRERGILVRAGHHCAPMATEAIGAPAGTVRISFGAFSGEEDVAQIVAALDDAARIALRH